MKNGVIHNWESLDSVTICDFSICFHIVLYFRLGVLTFRSWILSPLRVILFNAASF